MGKSEYEATIKIKMNAENPQAVRAVLGGMLQRAVYENTHITETDLQSISLILPKE